MNYQEYKKNNINNFLKKEYDADNVDNYYKAFLNNEMCKECISDDRCCNKYPCIFAPSDFLDITDMDYMKSILDTGLVYVNIFKNSNFLTIRPTGKREIYNNSSYINNTCVFYNSKTGCMLDDYMRPTQGLLFMARREFLGKCRALYTKDDIYNEYKPYQDILKKLYYYQFSIDHYIDDAYEKEEKIKTLVKKITGVN